MKYKKFVLAVSLVLAMLLLVACTDDVTVTFVYGDGFDDQTQTVAQGSAISAPTTPTKDGYVFVSWFTDAACTEGNEWNFSSAVEEDLTLYAKWTPDNLVTVAQALEIAEALSEGEVTEERYMLNVTIKNVSNPTYGEMTVFDETGEIYVYGSYSADGETRYSELSDKPVKGDRITITALIQNYKGTPELKSVWIQSVDHVTVDVDESDYTELTVAQAREAADGTLVKVSGVVAAITYANGKIPSGFYLIDNTNCIYVYDDQIAPQVSVGNTVTVLASKTHWILDDETANAEKFGYNGCNQLESAILTANDKGSSDFDTSWITSSSVKELLETPVTEDIATTVFKVNALIKKVEGQGFVNYYIDDLDGTTGSYVYTQCNGSDFAWLDEFDNGKVHTVYLSAINAKSTSTDCFWRLFPVKVVDENFDPSTVDAAKFAVDYFGVEQFAEIYSADPALELVTSVSVEALEVSGATISYKSSDTDVVYFETADGKTVMHTKNDGSATITLIGSYNGKTYEKELSVEVKAAEAVDSITVAEAIAAEVDEQITVRGIVGPSLVNQDGGFYLIDETGVIAVKLGNAEDIDGLSIGDEIIVSGKRDAYKKQGSYPGQTCITSATVEVNLYGKHDYSTATFTESTFDEMYKLAQDTTVDQTTKVFVVEVKITKVVSQYFTNYYIGNADDSETILLYAKNGGQYSWLDDYVDKTVKIEVALCNWNAKAYKACVLAVYQDDGTKICNTLNFGD